MKIIVDEQKPNIFYFVCKTFKFNTEKFIITPLKTELKCLQIKWYCIDPLC